MEDAVLPKTWQDLLKTSETLPVIVRSLEKFHDISWSMEPNRHEFFEMVYIKKGNAVFEIAGQPVAIGPNDIIIIKPNQLHKFIVKSQSGCEFVVLNFKFENKIRKEVSEISLEDFLNFVSGRESGPFLTLKVNQKNDIIVVMDRILNERQSDEIGSEFLCHLLIMELFVLISRALKMEWENSIKKKSAKIKEIIRISTNYIDNNYERDISIADIAKYVFLSQSYFTRVFKEETGLSPMSYLISVRIRRAKELLRDTELKVSEIAQAVGFSNQQRFNEIFKKNTGYTPLQFRKIITKVKKH